MVKTSMRQSTDLSRKAPVEQEDTEPWAFIDVQKYWEPGYNVVGTYGKVEFVSDSIVRGYTESLRADGLDDRYFIIRVRSTVSDMYLFAIYDDYDHTVVDDTDNALSLFDKVEIIKAIDKAYLYNIVEMAKKINR